MENDNRKFGILSSSEDPTRLADTVKGAILASSALLLLFAKMLGLPFTETEVITLATQAGLAISSLWFFYGLVKKLIILFVKKD